MPLTIRKRFCADRFDCDSPNFVLVICSTSASVAELIALEEKTGQNSFASTGTGTSTHLAALLAMVADVKLPRFLAGVRPRSPICWGR
jgi:hypothetical protein